MSKVGKKAEVREEDAFVPTDEEFEAEWMAEHSMEKGTDWVPPSSKGDVMCEVRLRDGTVVAPCGRDGARYRRLDGEKDLPADQVEAVRFYEHALEKDEGGPGFGEEVP